MLEVPTDSTTTIEKGFQILEDWAQSLTFDPVEIDKERGVVIEEWRLGRGANERIFNKQVPVLFKDSKYAERLPIGKKEIIEKSSYETLKSFYKTWYRPDLMAVVAVGDYDINKIETLVKEHFSGITNPKTEKERTLLPVPDQDNISFSIVTDPEATNTMVSFYHRLNVAPQDKVKDYRRQLVEGLFNQMFNERLSELSRKADPPFLYSYSGKGNYVRTKDFYILGAVVKEDGLERGFKAMLTEAQRVRKFGFTETELTRSKQNMLSSIEQAFNEKNKTESGQYADELARHFLTGEPAPGIAYEFELYKQYLPGITLEEINRLSDEWIQEKNSVLLVSAPEKKDVKIPNEADLKAIFENIKNTPVTAYKDVVSDLPLVETPPVPSPVISSKNNNELKLTEYILGNGVRVILKPTDFKNDEIAFYGYGSGGTSLSDSATYIPAMLASQLVLQSGVGKFNFDQLQKVLSGKVVRVGPYIGELTEGVTGQSSVKDMETMFKLIYLYFTSPRIDSSSFFSYQTKIQNWLKNKDANPESVYQDTLEVTLGNYNYRRMPMTEKTIPMMDISKSLIFYKARFADASGFTFVFVGNFDTTGIKPLLEEYLGGLPSLKKNEMWKDLQINPVAGVINKQVYKGVEPKSQVNITFSGKYNWNTENNYELNSMIEVLRIKLREELREDKSGTYGVSVRGNPAKFPEERYTITISFGCAPERVDELVKTTFLELDSLKDFKVGDEYIQKVRETQKREFEVSLKENNFWVNTLQYYYFVNNDLSLIMKFPERIANLNKDMIQNAARNYFDMNNYIKVVLYPQKM
jgi:zinc protease